MTALLHDKLAQKDVVVAVTHLKAKAGADNEQTRVYQVSGTQGNQQQQHARTASLQHTWPCVSTKSHASTQCS